MPLVAEPSPEWLVAAFAILQAGGAVVPLDPEAPGAFAEIEARRVFTTSDLADSVAEETGEVDLVLLDEAADDDEQSWRRLLGDPARLREADFEIEPDQDAALFASRDVPRFVPLSHGALASRVEALQRRRLLRSSDRLLCLLPWHAPFPFVAGVLLPIHVGAPIVLHDGDVEMVARDARVSVVLGSPSRFEAMIDEIEEQARGAGGLSAALFRIALACSGCIRPLGICFGRYWLAPWHRYPGRLRLLVSPEPFGADLARRLERFGWRLASAGDEGHRDT